MDNQISDVRIATEVKENDEAKPINSGSGPEMIVPEKKVNADPITLEEKEAKAAKTRFIKELIIGVVILIYSVVSFIVLMKEYTVPLKNYQNRKQYEIFKISDIYNGGRWEITYSNTSINQEETTETKVYFYILVQKNFEIKNAENFIKECQTYSDLDEAHQIASLVNSDSNFIVVFYYFFIVFSVLFIAYSALELYRYIVGDKEVRKIFESPQQGVRNQYMSVTHAGASTAILIPVLQITYGNCINGEGAFLTFGFYVYIFTNYFFQNSLFVSFYIFGSGRVLNFINKTIESLGNAAQWVGLFLTAYIVLYIAILLYYIIIFCNPLIMGVVVPQIFIYIGLLCYYLIQIKNEK